jgi:signal transduction histidine kinase/putative methionine-R-sulfoxide reductase with GAF domain
MDYLQTYVTPVIVFLYLLAALGVLVVTPVLFMRTMRQPFIGAFVEHTRMINTATPAQPGVWGEQLRLPFGYQIQAVGDTVVGSVFEYRRALETLRVGDEVALTLRDPEGQEQVVRVRLTRLPPLDLLSYFVVPYITGLIYLFSGWYVFGIRRRDAAGRAFSLFAASTAIALAGLFDLYTTNRLTSVWTFSLAIIGGALVNLALLFPERAPQLTRRPYLGWVGYAVGIALGVGALPTIYNEAQPTAYVIAWRLEFIFIGLSAMAFLGLTGVRRIRSASPIVREQARLIFWGALLSFAPLGLWFLATSIRQELLFTPLYLLPLGFFPIFTGYAILRYRLLHTDFLLSRTVLYTLLAGLATVGYGLLVSGLALILGDVFRPTNPLVVGLMIFILALGLMPLRNRLQTVIDRYFFRGQIIHREMLQKFGQDLTQVMDLEGMVDLLRRAVDQSLAPLHLHIYIYDSFAAHYQATKNEKGVITSDIRFSSSSPLVHVLGRRNEALFLSDMARLPPELQSEQARLSLLAATLYVPMPGRNQLLGWLALGPRRSGEPYNDRDLRFLEALGNQAALAVERAQVLTDLERRVREMNVLTRVAQGVSFTVAFDDMLELISAQTNQVLPARDFRVTLLDKETGLMQHAFCLEDDERIPEKEGRPLPAGQGLEAEVITSQRALMTDDYERECRERGLLPDAQGIYAWMSVPLNAGAETIGAISLASRDPAVIYTEEQRSLLQAIADQAAGAIVKARSLQESERRARQLAKLNEVSLSLTSTLDLKRLLNQIMQSAVEILNCQAGSLFLVDPHTDELIFEVVLGPVASNLAGRRLPAGTGLVGQAQMSGKPIIANDAKRRKEWFDKTDEQTGFDTQDLLVVPMRIQDRVIGVIEVINKLDGAPFTQSDQELLSAFTSQATIAIENARLYTMTDQALAATVEELEMMQRIDRELNASLDIERAMRLTLDWAMRQSRAEAGLVGAMDGEGVRVMVAQGYSEDLAGALQSDSGARVADDSENGRGVREKDSAPRPASTWRLPAEHPAVRQAIESGAPLCTPVEDGGGDRSLRLMENARQRIVVPIRRETTTIGLILLESAQSEPCPDETLNFLARLSDHAAIAIANAQLYEEVKEANLAKSRFVSFVAHELKNPMASIKGYTELVSSGMAGPVNEMQSSFLATVRSNVDRMNTIVSDLNDLTKIQVGNLRLEYRAVQITEVLEDVIRSMKRQVDDKGQQMTLHLQDNLPPVWADPARLAQILTNLVSNAHKYTPENGRFEIGVERYSETQGVLAGTEMLHIWVKDYGIGISEEDQKRVFQQYFRTDDAKEMASGTGLGLSITKSLVEMQGGRIWFESVLGSGTTFHFTVPIVEVQ